MTLTDCHHFVDTQPPSVIAARLKHDQSLCRSPGGALPSLLVYCLPTRIDPIARVLNDDPRIDITFARLHFKSIVSEIKNYLANLGSYDEPEEIPAHLKPTDDELHATLKVLQYLQLPHLASSVPLPPKLTIEELSGVVQFQLSLGPKVREISRVKIRPKLCYICRYAITCPHKLYPAMCHPCGEFNIASSSMSMSPHLDLCEKTALVTGGRINLGFRVALRLLRCGASVIISSRYPLDAEQRYLRELDAKEWKDRLRIVGADFRTAGDVFDLVHTVVRGLKEEWGKEKLDILINNAAQTQVDSLEMEREGIKREEGLLGTSNGLVLHTSYTPRLRGGQNIWKYLGDSEGASEHLLENGSTLEISSDSRLTVSTHLPHPVKSSWTQKISDIPYEDIVSTHSINAFVPFILIRELMSYMGTSELSGSTKGPMIAKPAAYIVNVSSREGQPAMYPTDPHKARGIHVHTNMSKAALNMLTETQAMSSWRQARVAVNSVDPGYLSADPGYNRKEKGSGDGEVDECPLDWEDGAARVIWPIAVAEREGKVIHGKFLKHFMKAEARRVRSYEVSE